MVYTVDHVVEFGCDDGFYSSEPEPKTTCTVIGAWEDPPPLCKRVSCGPPELPQHSSIHGGDGGFLYGSEYVYHCDQGYEMKVTSFIQTNLCL